jgi:hypothetical protein
MSRVCPLPLNTRLSSGVSACLLAWAMAIGALVFHSGCSKTAESYVPASDQAQASVERALAAWQSGAAAGRIEPATAGQVPLQAVDRDWMAGKKLAAYEIVSELPREAGPRRFSVRLTLHGAASPVEATYYVVGQNPLWIFRDRDYMQTTTM